MTRWILDTCTVTLPVEITESPSPTVPMQRLLALSNAPRHQRGLSLTLVYY